MLVAKEVTFIFQGSQWPLEMYHSRTALTARMRPFVQELNRRLFPWYIPCRWFADQEGRAYNQRELDATFGTLLRRGRNTEGRYVPVEDSTVDMCRAKLRGSDRKAQRLGRVLPSTHVHVHNMAADIAPFLSGPVYDIGLDSKQVLAFIDDGRLAWIPDCAVEDDVLALLQGAPFPIVVRSRGDNTYQLLGDAYVHGIVDGSAWAANRSGVKSIYLR